MAQDYWDVVVVGAGAAGLLAAIRAAERGRRTLLLEKNNKPGVKILMSGGTRCNLTQATDRTGIAAAFTRDQGRFLRSPLAALGPDELVDLFNAEGVATKVEATGKIFPASDRALDVQRALLARLGRTQGVLALGEGVTAIARQSEAFRIATTKRVVTAERLVIATGGQSYPGCGTTGDGYAWAKSLGHSIVPPRPALVPLKTAGAWSHELSGITLPDVKVSVVEPGSSKPLAKTRGSFLFTHVGLSGPAVMDVSHVVSSYPKSHGVALVCDLLPSHSEEVLLGELAKLAGKQLVINFLASHLPRRVAEGIFQVADLPLERTSAELSKQERRRLLSAIKACRFEIAGTLGFAKAEVTAGGVALGEVDSRTMASKRCEGLYLIGEVLDLHGPIGGYNFQAAFSTGWLAGESV